MRLIATVLIFALLAVFGVYLSQPGGAWLLSLLQGSDHVKQLVAFLEQGGVSFTVSGVAIGLLVLTITLYMIWDKNAAVRSLEAQINAKIVEVERWRKANEDVATRLQAAQASKSESDKKLTNAEAELRQEREKNAEPKRKPAPSITDIEASLSYHEKQLGLLDASLSQVEEYENGDEDLDWRPRLEKIKAEVAALRGQIEVRASRKAVGDAMTEIEQLMSHIEHEAGNVENAAVRSRIGFVRQRLDNLAANLDEKPSVRLASSG